MSQTTNNPKTLLLQLGLFASSTDYKRIEEICKKTSKSLNQTVSVDDTLLEATLNCLIESKGKPVVDASPALKLYAQRLYTEVPVALCKAGATEEEVQAFNYPLQREILLSKSKMFDGLANFFGSMENIMGFEAAVEACKTKMMEAKAEVMAENEAEGGTEC